MICDGEELILLIERYVNGKKAQRNREILKSYFIGGKTYEEIAEEQEMSSVQIGKIVHKCGDPILLMLKKF